MSHLICCQFCAVMFWWMVLLKFTVFVVVLTLCCSLFIGKILPWTVAYFRPNNQITISSVRRISVHTALAEMVWICLLNCLVLTAQPFTTIVCFWLTRFAGLHHVSRGWHIQTFEMCFVYVPNALPLVSPTTFSSDVKTQSVKWLIYYTKYMSLVTVSYF